VSSGAQGAGRGGRGGAPPPVAAAGHVTRIAIASRAQSRARRAPLNCSSRRGRATPPAPLRLPRRFGRPPIKSYGMPIRQGMIPWSERMQASKSGWRSSSSSGSGAPRGA
jgi:hypothetical protein